jgi:hypothetical protein
MFGRASMPIRIRRGLTEITMGDKNGNDSTIIHDSRTKHPKTKKSSEEDFFTFQNI